MSDLRRARAFASVLNMSYIHAKFQPFILNKYTLVHAHTPTHTNTPRNGNSKGQEWQMNCGHWSWRLNQYIPQYTHICTVLYCECLIQILNMTLTSTYVSEMLFILPKLYKQVILSKLTSMWANKLECSLPPTHTTDIMNTQMGMCALDRGTC